MNWKQNISQINSKNTVTQYILNSPVPHFLLHELQNEFGLEELPSELVSLYEETNGIREILDGQIIGELIWTIERVIKTNKEYRNHQDYKQIYMSFDQLVFVSDAGNGDLFGFVTLSNRFDRFDIFVWNHEDDSRKWVAPNLTKFIEWSADGKIQV